MHVFVAAIASDDDYLPENIMDGLSGIEFDYYDALESETIIDGIDLSAINTVGDMRRIGVEKMVKLLYGLAVYKKMYGNPFNLYTLEQEQELYKRVLEGYDDTAMAKVFDVHI